MIFSGGCQETKDQKSLFCLYFLFFKYWNKSKEKKVPYFSFMVIQSSVWEQDQLLALSELCAGTHTQGGADRREAGACGRDCVICGHVTLMQICQIWYCEKEIW